MFEIERYIGMQESFNSKNIEFCGGLFKETDNLEILTFTTHLISGILMEDISDTL